jgi:hypothetical protein
MGTAEFANAWLDPPRRQKMKIQGNQPSTQYAIAPKPEGNRS